MCECGCVAIGERHRLPGPNGIVYEIALDPPCQDCDSPVGVTVHKYDKQAAKDGNIADTKPLKFYGEKGAGYDLTGLSVLYPPHVHAALTRWMKDRDFGKDEHDREGFAEEIWESYLLPLLFLDVVDNGTKSEHHLPVDAPLPSEQVGAGGKDAAEGFLG